MCVGGVFTSAWGIREWEGGQEGFLEEVTLAQLTGHFRLRSAPRRISLPPCLRTLCSLERSKAAS